ncbi:MAG: lysophospholipid acyltransferase family protein [Pseudomonadota bacterium]
MAEAIAPPTAVASVTLAALRGVLFIGWTLVCFPVQAACLLVSRRAATAFPTFFHRRLARFLGFRVTVYGQRSAARPTLFVCNHLSYIDIVVLGGAFEGSFISKADVRSWPVFGLLARMQRTIFIARSREAIRGQSAEIADRLRAGDALMLFAEGTSTDGAMVRPFMASLFGVAQPADGETPVVVQPVTLAYHRVDGMPITRLLRPYVCWYGDMDLAGHAPKMLGLGVIDAAVIFHPPQTIAGAGGRKALAAYCENACRAGLESAHRSAPAPYTAAAA